MLFSFGRDDFVAKVARRSNVDNLSVVRVQSSSTVASCTESCRSSCSLLPIVHTGLNRLPAGSSELVELAGEARFAAGQLAAQLAVQRVATSARLSCVC